MHITLIFALLFSSAQLNNDSLLQKQSKEQASIYIDRISQGIETDAHLWALVTLLDSNPDIQPYIAEELKRKNNKQTIFRPFISSETNTTNLLKEIVFTTGSPSLLVELLLRAPDANARKEIKREFKNIYNLPNNGDIDYEKLTNHINSGTKIDLTVLPNDTFHLPHLFLLLDRYGRDLISSEYKLSALSEWENILKSKDSDLFQNILMKISYLNLAYFLDEFDEIKPLYNFLITDRYIPNSTLKYRLLRYFDYSMYRIGNYDLSLSIIKDRTIPLTKYLEDKRLELSTLTAQAAYLDHIGKIKEAQKVNLEILEKAELYEINVPKSTIYTNLGITYKESGKFDQHLNLQLKALEEATKLGKYDHQLKILLILHHFYLQNKDKSSALLYLNKARDLAEREGNSEHLGRVNTYLGVLYRDLDKDYKKSLDYFEKAENLFDPKTDFTYYVQLLDEKAKLYQELNKPNLSRETYKKIAELSKSRDTVTLIENYLQIIDLDLKQGNLQNAKELLSVVKTYDLSQLDFEPIIKAKTVEAAYLASVGEKDEALKILKPTISRVVDRAKNSADLQSGYWKVAPEYLDAFDLTTELLIETAQEKLAVEILDKLKTINDASLYQNPMVKSSLLDESELTQYQRLTGQLDVLRKKQLLAGEKEQLDIQSKINRLIAQKNILDRKISDLVDQKSMSVDQVQRQLGGREMVLHVTELKDQYYIARISRHEVNFNKIALDSTIRDQFNSAIKNLSVGKTDINQLSKISGILNLESIPAWVNTLTIIPDSYLYQLPIDVLPITSEGFDYSYGNATYVVEKFTTHYLTSLNDFALNKEKKENYTWDFAGYGVSEFPSYANTKNLVPLPYAESEVSNIVEDLTNMANKTAYLDSSSTERTFKETAPRARILHLATHSELSERDPLFSTIYMSAENSEGQDEEFSGQIFAYELFELNLSNDLIMLNSCESGSGSYLQGTGVMGISRALRYAGANSLILNLWSVNDMMASDFAIEFYKNINQGQAKDEALRQAKLHFLKNKNANPHYWGPYMLIGNRDPLVRPNRETNIYFAGAFMLFFITIASISLLQDRKEKAA